MSGIEILLDAVRIFGPERDRYRTLGAIRAVPHPDGEHLIFTYTEAAAVRGEWNPVERVARGLIVHWPTARVVARPFDKFFALNQAPETRLEALPAGPVEVTAKMDGSLGVLWRGPDGYAVATRGSFTGAQAEWATRHLRGRYDLTGLPADVTLLFEIIYPRNRVVVNYGATEDLVLIGARRLDGFDYPHMMLVKIGEQFGFPVVPSFPGAALNELALAAETITGIEGWVVRFPNGLRVKVKTMEYIKISRALNMLRPEAILSMLREGSAAWDQFHDAVPEDLLPEVDGLANAIETYVAGELARLDQLMDQLCIGPAAVSRKEFALAVRANALHDAPLLFALFNEREGTAKAGQTTRDILLRHLDPLALALPETGGGFRRFDESLE